jgi:ankyrin repeat protein
MAAREAQEQAVLRFLNALNAAGGASEAHDYLTQGGDIDAPITPLIEQTLLHHAAINRRADLVAMLIARGADLNRINAMGMTALHLAVMHEINAMQLGLQQEPDLPCARTLVALGASIEAIDNHGKTPRDFALMCGGTPMADLFDAMVLLK